jgi:RNA polymerase sigma factor (sigma-70 family)
MKSNSIYNETTAARIAAMARGDEDLAQDMWLALVEKNAASLTFAAQEIGYHIKAAKFARGHTFEKRATYDKYVEVEQYIVTDDGDEESVFDRLAGDDPTPEEALERKQQTAALQAALSALTAHQRRVAQLLLAGYTTAEIAAKMGTSKSSVSHMTRKLLETLARVL